jgi:hypothetical protein
MREDESEDFDASYNIVDNRNYRLTFSAALFILPSNLLLPNPSCLKPDPRARISYRAGPKRTGAAAVSPGIAMSVVVRPIGLLKAFCRDRLDELDRIVLADRDGSTLEAVCQDIGLPAGLVSLFIVNGHIQERSYRLQTGDDVKCVAIIGGG